MHGKVVLVTGSSSGIGAGIAVEFASRGCYLALTGRDISGLEETRQACVQAGTKEENILLIPTDLRVQENLAMIIDKTTKKFEKLDVLVNNAGCGKAGGIEDTSVDNYDLIMDTNMKSVFFLTQLALPYLIHSKGNIVNVSSYGSHRVLKQSIVYCMSKAALDHFTRIVALDMASKNVRVNAVNPRGVKTKILERSGLKFSFEENVSKMHAIARAGKVEEIAKAVLFLADDVQSSFITGVTMFVDGGANLMGPG